ncbi:MAG: SDR family oxidoreductase [Rhodospirillales bacterium]|jgi:NAD(P)-dependent dehydrogenase (short-subunit alcohol dehydrogenase family)|nr:SDR family oxidoreductase [Rhodospirillales bacterium]
MKKNVVVTGAASGIGQAIAIRASQDGHRIITVDIQDSSETVAKIIANGGKATAYSCDLRNDGSVIDLFDRIEEGHGDIDILINNAGTMGRWPLNITETTEDDWYTIFDTNVKSVYLCCRQVLPGMRKRGCGIIVNIASELAFKSAEGCTIYCASKGAVVQFTRALAVEEAKSGIRINAVCPGPIDTGLINPTLGEIPEDNEEQSFSQTALKRLGKPEEIAEVVWFAASEGASYMIGSVIMADGGVLAS